MDSKPDNLLLDSAFTRTNLKDRVDAAILSFLPIWLLMALLSLHWGSVAITFGDNTSALSTADAAFRISYILVAVTQVWYLFCKPIFVERWYGGDTTDKTVAAASLAVSLGVFAVLTLHSFYYVGGLPVTAAYVLAETLVVYLWLWGWMHALLLLGVSVVIREAEES